MLDRIIHVNLQNPGRIVDVGCGSGIVSGYLGSTFGTAQVLAIDLSAVPIRSKPSNVTFIEGEIRALVSHDERLSSSSVDFVFSRLLMMGMSDWPGYVRDMAILLRPGGWIEVQEFVIDAFLNGEYCSAGWKWLQALHKAAENRGWDLRAGKHVKVYMEQAGLVEVQAIEYRIPWGTWASGERPETKWIGAHAATEYGAWFNQALPKVLSGTEYTKAEIEDFQTDCMRDLAERAGMEVGFWVTTGKKA